jgi:serine/threonine protein kinase
MEYVPGNTLFDLMPKSNKENWSERAEEWTHRAIQLFTQLLSAVRYAHNCIHLDLAGNVRRGVLHGDIKPGNILIDQETDKLKLTDFMIPDVQAYLGKPKDSYGMFPLRLNFGDLSKNDETKSLTLRELAILSERFRFEDLLSETFGTPEYMAPEQKEGLVSVRTDIFTLGTTLYEILTGYSPAFRYSNKPRNSNPFIPKWTKKVILKSTHPDPSQRYNSVAEIEAIFQENYKPQIPINYAIKEWIMGDKIDVKTGDISGASGQLFIGKFNSVIANLNSLGQSELANALTTLKQAVMASEHIPEENKQEHVEVINKIGEEATKETPNKTLMKVMGDGLLSILKSVPDVAKAVTAVAPFFNQVP